MIQTDNQEREIVYWSAALAIVPVLAIFVASMSQANLLLLLIDSNVLLMIFGTIVLIRISYVAAIFFDPDRPPEARTFSSIFRKDEWLSDHAKLSQPRFFKALGATLLFWQFAMLAAVALAALFVSLRIMSIGQATSMFVIGTLLWALVQTVGACILLLRQMHCMRTNRQS